MITVFLATRNRARILKDVLACFCDLLPPESGWKFVVIDNGSTDETSQVLASFVDRLPLHIVFERCVGKNYALNAGLDLVEGDLAVFTDDDVFPHADWLVQLRRAADMNPSYSIFGGQILPRWQAPPVPWTRWIDLGPIFTITDPLLGEGPLSPGLFLTAVQGPNMAVRTSVFRSGLRFDPYIGPSGPNYPMGSESELILRLRRQGDKAWYVQGAIVEHLVRHDQLDKSWAFKRAIRFGRGLHRLCHKGLFPDVKLWGGVPRHLLRDIPKEIFLMAGAWVLCRPDIVFRARWRLNVLWGKAIEARIVAREQRNHAKAAAPDERLSPES
jgi:glycosyltransferase involved in cell wall biosynthesis